MTAINSANTHCVGTDFAYLDNETIGLFDSAGFKANRPFPWCNLQGLLTAEGFKSLYDNFPSLDLFEQHSGIKRGNNQRPHNRYYLAYENSIYRQEDREDSSKGVVKLSQLPQPWQSFIQTINTHEPYRELIKSLFDVLDYRVRFAWHVGFNGCEVSPHVDSPDKIGTHILYFNTSDDWLEDWGGAPLVLDGKQTAARNPDYPDFTSAQSVSIIDNRSFLFKNAPDAWHGVKPLCCPEGSYRRLFNIVFEFPPAPADKMAGLKARVPTSLKFFAKGLTR